MKTKELLNTAVVVAALGYFVDVYDLVLFLVVGKKSLADLGIPIENFELLLNVQMIGMLIGGIVWGVMGDKNGRISVLFGSILTYSLANIANAFVPNLEMYIALRFIAGFGLAGELGAGVTLVSEIMKKENRGYGTMLIASIGVTGAVVAGLVGQIDWKVSYLIGGGLGISLLLLRIGVFESGMFNTLKQQEVSRGNFFALFYKRETFLRYLNCIMLGLPVWFIIGILVGQADKFGKALGIQGDIVAGLCVMFCYAGLVFGDLASGALSQILQSRKKVFVIFYILCLLNIAIYLNINGMDVVIFYSIIFFLGFSVGFWAIFVTIASEQFGTNVRATVTTTVPNFVRGSLVPITIVFKFIVSYMGLIQGTAITAVIIFAICFASLWFTKETFGKDLDYFEYI
ncbi:MAG: MFS transporter [Cytophagales bacterium]|nr:MFS transporter [Cytophagales bacterium]